MELVSNSGMTVVLMIINEYIYIFFPTQVRGHNIADLDPLGIGAADLDSSNVPELTTANYGLGRTWGLPLLDEGGELGMASRMIRLYFRILSLFLGFLPIC